MSSVAREEGSSKTGPFPSARKILFLLPSGPYRSLLKKKVQNKIICEHKKKEYRSNLITWFNWRSTSHSPLFAVGATSYMVINLFTIWASLPWIVTRFVWIAAILQLNNVWMSKYSLLKLFQLLFLFEFDIIRNKSKIRNIYLLDSFSGLLRLTFFGAFPILPSPGKFEAWWSWVLFSLLVYSVLRWLFPPSVIPWRLTWHAIWLDFDTACLPPDFLPLLFLPASGAEERRERRERWCSQ